MSRSNAVVQLEGARELRSTLRRASGDLSELKAVNARAAGIVTPVGKANTPVGPDRGGHIRDTVRPGASNTAAIVRAGGAAKPYGGVIHFGWRRRGITPNPWLFRAAETTQPRWIAVYLAGVERIIDKIKGA